nr:ribonuclease H-like domain, reverse transcriptase, RNA-dependent DNA polymerase [Tanacetum cinerariifolium]
MDQQNPTLAKISILDTGKFEQWQFQIQQYLQHEHYALWEVIEFGDSYEAPAVNPTTDSASDGTSKKKERAVTLTADDIQKRKNDVKARTTLLLSLPDEHQIRFSKYKTTQELWAAILKTFGGNEATKKTKKNLLKQQYDNFKAEGSKTLEQMFNRLGSQIKFEDINKIDEDDMEEMDIKWNMDLLSMRADSIQGTDVAGFDKSKVPKALMAIDGVRWDWSYMANDEKNHALVADEEAPTEFALMAKTNAESEKLGLAQVEARLAEHRSQELKYYEKIRVLEFKTESGANCIESLTKDLELLKKEKGYSAVPPPAAQIYSPPKKDMSWTGLLEFKDDTVTDYSRPSPAIESILNDVQNRNPSVTKIEASPITISPKSFIKFVKANDSPTKSKPNKVETAKKPPVKYAEQYRKPTKNPNGEKETSRSQNNTHKSFTPRPVVHRPYRPPMRPMRSNMNVAQTKKHFFHQPAHLYNKRPFQRTSAVRSQFRDPRVATVNRKFPTVNRKLPTVNRKFPTGNINFSTADMGNKGKAIKASACWFWKPSQNLSNKGPNSNSVSVIFKKYTYIDTQGRLNGCSRHMTGNISYLSDYEPFDGGYVSFGQGGCKITGKGTIKTGKLEFENVYFMKDLNKPQDDCSTDAPESSGNSNPTTTSTNPPADQLETLTAETPISTISSPVPTASLNDSLEPSSDTRLISKRVANQVETPSLDNILTLTNRFEDILGVTTNSVDLERVEADVSNMETTITASPTPTLRIHKDHPKSQIIGPVDTLIQTWNKSKEVGEQSFIAIIHQKTDPALLQFCLFSCFLSQVEPKKISDALQDPSWVEAMQEELLQFKIQNVWTLVDYPKGVRPIGTKWVLKNKKDKRGIVIRNKARLVAQGHTQEEGIDYDEVFAPVARIKAIRLFLAYASFMGFTVYQMDVKSAFLYGDILKKLGYLDVRSANTPMDKENPWGKDRTRKDVDLHHYRSMIGSLMYLTASRPDIMFAVCACARHQVTPKECYLHAVKRIFRYLKGHPKLGLWYPKESPFDLVAYSDSDYGGTIMATSTTEAGYVAAAMDFVEASPFKYALTFKPTVYVSHIRQFWSTTRIETTEEGTKILATIDGNLRTVFESSIRRNLKLNDEAGISSLPDAELFENLTLMGYNISPN